MNWEPGTVLVWGYRGEDRPWIYRTIIGQDDDGFSDPVYHYWEYHGNEDNSYLNEQHKVCCTSFRKRP